MRKSQTTLQWFSSCILAITWVGYYGYNYNVNIFNTHLINIWAWFLWTVCGFLFLQVFYLLKMWVRHPAFLLIITWLLYFTSLIFLEYTGYYLLQIREVKGGNNDLIWGLVHGTPTLHIYYTFFPFIILSVYGSLVFCSGKIEKLAVKSKERMIIRQL